MELVQYFFGAWGHWRSMTDIKNKKTSMCGRSSEEAIEKDFLYQGTSGKPSNTSIGGNRPSTLCTVVEKAFPYNFTQILSWKIYGKIFCVSKGLTALHTNKQMQITMFLFNICLLKNIKILKVSVGQFPTVSISQQITKNVFKAEQKINKPSHHKINSSAISTQCSSNPGWHVPHEPFALSDNLLPFFLIFCS